jgi:hypothetical protein
VRKLRRVTLTSSSPDHEVMTESQILTLTRASSKLIHKTPTNSTLDTKIKLSSQIYTVAKPTIHSPIYATKLT